jgi:hypothetical protein
MMGRESFILLKAGFLGPKSAKQAERRPDVLPTILSIAGPEKNLSALHCCRFPLDMANFVKFADFVIQITVLAGILAHYPAWEGRGKMPEVLRSSSIRWTTSQSFPIHADGALLLDIPARNTFPPHKSDPITREWPSLQDDVTQALDGFAVAGPMICKLRPLKII